MKHYRIIRVETKRTYFKIQRKGLFGWKDLRRTEAAMGVTWTELITFSSDGDAVDYINNNFRPFEVKEFIMQEFSF